MYYKLFEFSHAALMPARTTTEMFNTLCKTLLTHGATPMLAANWQPDVSFLSAQQGDMANQSLELIPQ